MLNALTIDVEDYFQVTAFERALTKEDWDHMPPRVSENTRRLLDILDDHEIHATFFVLGWVAERHRSLVREIQRRGHEIACHGYGHDLIHAIGKQRFRRDVHRSKRVLEDIAGAAVKGYRAPSYSITERSLWALDVLIEEGFRYDSSIFPIYHDTYGMPDAPRFPHLLERRGKKLWEFPLTTLSMKLAGWRCNFPIAGGGYLRFIPAAFIGHGISRINTVEGKPVVLYVHPWEIDPDQPRITARFKSRLRHYFNLTKTEAKLRPHPRLAPIRHHGLGARDMTGQSFTVSSELDEAAWDSFVAGCPEATAYHRYAWRRVIANSFGHRSHYLAALDSAGAPHGVLPLFHMKSALFGNFLVSLPFVNYGGLLCRTPEAGAVLLEAADELRRSLGARYVELRHLGRSLPGLPTNDRKVTMLLPLSATAEEQWARLDPKVRNQIRKAGKSGLRCAIGGAELLDDFYRVFAHNMRDLGTPVYSKRLFREVVATLPEGSRVMVVRRGGKTVAAGIATGSGDNLEMPWASSLAESRPLCPNNLLYWEAISFAIGKGHATFDFGRSTVGEGTYRFKKQWGAQPVQLYWQYLFDQGEELPGLNPQNPKYRLAVKAWQRLPVALTRLIGPPIVRNIP
ncbi:hypothetical protein GMSM_08690 [Geomonas sp. Red276]